MIVLLAVVESVVKLEYLLSMVAVDLVHFHNKSFAVTGCAQMPNYSTNLGQLGLWQISDA